MADLPVMLQCHHRDGTVTSAVVRDFEPAETFMVPGEPEPRTYRRGAEARQFVHVWTKQGGRGGARIVREELCRVVRYWEEVAK